MTAIVFIVCMIAGWLWYPQFGRELTPELTIYTAAYWTTTACMTAFCLREFWRGRGWRFFAAPLCVILYCMFAHKVYYQPDAILRSGTLSLFVAAYFLIAGRHKWEIYAGLCFCASTLVSVLTVDIPGIGLYGLIPDHIDRGSVFMTFSQPDITGVLDHAANCIIGLGAADFGVKVRSHLVKPMVAGDVVWSVRAFVLGNSKTHRQG